ncbi:MAG: hypothetical protein HS111_17190 [Kofleriaceae bacterium]|nr:hypothetical protein [Kofleriaceae bacterium]MCL4223095.1 hypothetical protein [Myxococcales bacterium]
MQRPPRLVSPSLRPGPALAAGLACAVGMGLTAPAAIAESPPDKPPPPGLTLGQGKLNVAVNLELELSQDRVGKPFSISPDVSYGVTPDLTVALVHSRFATTGFRAAAGGGLCLAGDDGGCVAVYNNVGLEGWYSVARGPTSIAVGGGVHALNLDAGFYNLKLGARLRHVAGKLGFHALPSVIVAVTERDDGAGNRLNKDTLWVPVQVTYNLAPLTVGLGTGVKGALSGFGDAYQIPLGFMALYAVDKTTTVGASWVFGQVISGATNPPDPSPPVEGFALRGVQLWGSRTF